ncbi:MAG TPA: glycosyl hydrolase family 28-related protein [Rhizomicrobium sp.]|nr:glycosyl hydrolase family 28-related protein [Rhizomicrobium sp.]
MNRRDLLLTAALSIPLAGLAGPAVGKRARPRARIGADIAWTTYQAQDMKTTGTVMGPQYGPYLVQMESAHQTCVRLAAGQHIEFKAAAAANTLVVRYSLPDSADGRGIDSTLLVFRNGKPLPPIAITSRFCRLYGDYPFVNDPAAGKPRNFYDDARVKGLTLAKGDVIRLEKPTDAAEYCIIDIVDLEHAPPPLRRPRNSVSLTDFGADRTGESDATAALQACLAAAAAQGRTAWAPPGTYKLTGDVEMPSGVRLQGAGMWHTTFAGDEQLYDRPGRRLRFKLTGSNSTLCDFALDGRIKYRNDGEQNDGIFGAHGRNCTISRLWIEHTKVGMWFYVCSNMLIEGCRLRNTKADGINLCVDTRDCIVRNCTARNTGDDCFAIWPAPSDQGFSQEGAAPGDNVISCCTAETPFLAQGGAIYGGAGNRIEDCLFRDIASGCGILISTTFPTTDGKIDNNFSGTTVVKNCELIRCGGYDQGWMWRAALQICLHRRDISGLAISDVTIRDSLSDGIAVVNAADSPRTLRDARLERVRVGAYGAAVPGRHGLWIAALAQGGLVLVQSTIPDIANGSAEFQVSAQ